jgi:23S rRNA (guanine1835-N2)-methyltransferase
MTPEPLALPADATTHAWLRPLTLAISPEAGPRTRRTGNVEARAASAIKPFDAADEYLLHELSRRSNDAGAEILIVNDRYGALASALADKYRVTTWGDSLVSFETTGANLSSNGLDLDEVTFLPATSPLAYDESTHEAPFAAVLIRVPKSLSLLEQQLLEIRTVVKAQTPVICAGMEKHLSRRVNTLLGDLIGPPTASLGWRKSRLIMAYADPHVTEDRRESPFPTSYTVAEVKPPLTLRNHAGVFSRTGLDLGTRTMLPFLTQDLGDSSDPDVPLQVADLGCGNGVIGIISARSNPDAEYTFFDESFMAVRSAEENWNAAFPGRPATFITGHAMADTPPRTFDVIFCNPPFHQDHSVGDETAWRMFLSAHRALAPGGSFLIVGNRHLNYHNKLQRLFGRAEQLGGSPKFVVLHAERS